MLFALITQKRSMWVEIVIPSDAVASEAAIRVSAASEAAMSDTDLVRRRRRMMICSEKPLPSSFSSIAPC